MEFWNSITGQWILEALLTVIIFLVAWKLLGNKLLKREKYHSEEVIANGKENLNQPLPIEGAYQKRWLFSYNEKDAYNKLRPIAEKLGYTVLAKVRLLDLLEPVKGNPKYKTYFYKIQAKHVDFVLCDEKLVARYIVELDDSSHDIEGRKARDSFVDKVLNSVGYKIIHVRNITEDIFDKIKNDQGGYLDLDALAMLFKRRAA